MTTNYKSVGAIFAELAQTFRPPQNITVSEAAEEYRYVHQEGSYIGEWKNATTPYMVEPANYWSQREVKQGAFVGPAQSGKTDALVVNGVVFHTMVEPMDMVVYNPTQANARDFSGRRIDRLHTHSKKVGAQIRINSDADNKFDKTYASGMILSLSWPSVAEFAGKPIGRAILTDYDRMDDDVGGDGNPFDLATGRTKTYGSFAMTIAESSPSRPIKDAKWIARTAHEAPPTTGIFALYNRGDRRKWYWPCPACSEYFSGDFSHIVYDLTAGEPQDIAASARMKCPHCEEKIHFDHRKQMNENGLWLKDGQTIDRDGVVTGKPARTAIVSWWLHGVAAAFNTWKDLVLQFLTATKEYDSTGEEKSLQTFYNTALAEIYIPKSMVNDQRTADEIKGRAEVMPVRMVPAGVRFLVAQVDVQRNMFIYQVFGIKPGTPFDMVLIDRQRITKSKRIDASDDNGDHEWVKPHAYAEDWALVKEQVMDRTYPLDDGSDRVMGIKLTACDSGGKAGVTGMAYNFWRGLQAAGQSHRLMLVKGDPKNVGRERVRLTWPDASDKGNMAVARGDVPVWLVNSNVVKDMLDGRLDCVTPGKGMISFPDWLEDWFFAELCAEVRGPKGWEQKGKRNEAWDLCCYCIAMCLTKMLNVEKLDWDNPPAWAAPFDMNPYVKDRRKAAIGFANVEHVAYDFATLGKELAS